MRCKDRSARIGDGCSGVRPRDAPNGTGCQRRERLKRREVPNGARLRTAQDIYGVRLEGEDTHGEWVVAVDGGVKGFCV